MKKLHIWKGSDIGHGKRGGVLTIGSHEIKVGQEVPVSLLSAEALKSLRKKESIVDEDPESSEKDIVDPGIQKVKEATTVLNRAKKAVTASNKTLKAAKKAVKDQQAIYDKTPDEPEATKVEVEEALQALKSDLETAEAVSDADKKVVEKAKEALAKIDG